MNKKWMIKLGSLIVTAALITGCNTTNDNDENDMDTPQNTNAPENENINIEKTRYNNQNIDEPEEAPDEDDYHREHEGIQKKSKW